MNLNHVDHKYKPVDHKFKPSHFHLVLCFPIPKEVDRKLKPDLGGVVVVVLVVVVAAWSPGVPGVPASPASPAAPASPASPASPAIVCKNAFLVTHEFAISDSGFLILLKQDNLRKTIFIVFYEAHFLHVF